MILNIYTHFQFTELDHPTRTRIYPVTIGLDKFISDNTGLL